MHYFDFNLSVKKVYDTRRYSEPGLVLQKENKFSKVNNNMVLDKYK